MSQKPKKIHWWHGVPRRGMRPYHIGSYRYEQKAITITARNGSEIRLLKSDVSLLERFLNYLKKMEV